MLLSINDTAESLPDIINRTLLNYRQQEALGALAAKKHRLIPCRPQLLHYPRPMLIISILIVLICIPVYDLLHISSFTPSALNIGLDPVENLVAAPLTSLFVHQAFYLGRVVFSKVG